MILQLTIPDPLLKRLETLCKDVPTAVLEGFAIEAYRSGTLSRAEIGNLLGHASIWDTEAFLAEHNAWPAPALEEVAADIERLRAIQVA